MPARLLVAAALAVVAASGCSGSSAPAPRTTGPAARPSAATTTAPPTATSATPSAGPLTAGTPRTLVSGLDVPWGVAFLPGGDALVTERDTGRVLRVAPTGRVTVVTTLAVAAAGEGGLLGIAVSPHYANDHAVYAYETTAQDNRIVRFTLTGDTAGPPTPVLTGIPKGTIHDGGRIAFGPDGMLYAGTGETGDGALAQQPDSLGGKILRIRPDGAIPADNPFPHSPVWTLGHRNVQGLAWDAQGRMYAAEFGPDRDDEINLIVKGHDYGWPDVVGPGGGSRFTDPLVTFPPAQNSASGAAIAGGALWTAALRGERLWRVPLHPDGSLGSPQPLFVGGYGRLRTVVLAPDGSLWVTTSNRDGRGQPRSGDDRILRVPLVPASGQG